MQRKREGGGTKGERREQEGGGEGRGRGKEDRTFTRASSYSLDKP